MQAIGIDIGTTSICGLLVDCDSGEPLRTLTRPNVYTIKTENFWEHIQDARGIFSAVTELLSELYSHSVGAIGVTGQMHGIVYLDSEGRLLSPLYTWQDGRGELPLHGSTGSRLFGAPSGYGLTTDYVNEQLGLIDSRAAVVCTIHDYVAMRLSGRTSPLVHSSDAASLGRFNCERGEFHCLCERLPSTVKEVCVLGEYKKAAVCVAVGDNQASYVGSAAGGATLVNVGTGSQVSVPCNGYRHIEGLETRPLEGERYILVGSALCGGRAFALIERLFSEIASLVSAESGSFYPVLDRLLEAKPHTDLRFDTRFCGTRTEPWRRASIENLSEQNFTAADLARAAVEGIARELHGFYELTEEGCNRLVGSGNGIRKNPALRRAIEEQFGCLVEIPAHREEAAFGAALYAMYACGRYKSLEEAQGLIRYE